jgi:hypothetical protein
MPFRVTIVHLYFIVFLALSGALVIISYVSSNAFVKENIHLFYFIHFALIVAILPFVKEKMVFILSPTFLTLAYTYGTYILGGWAFNHDVVLWLEDLQAFWGWQHTNVTVSYTILCASLVHLSFFLISRRNVAPSTVAPIDKGKSKFLIVTAIVCFGIFSVIQLDVTFLGGMGDYSIIPKTLSALVLISVFALNRSKSRYIYYGLIIITFAAFSFNDKREAVLLILSVVLLESVSETNLKFSFKKVALFGMAVFMMIYLILAMSILRGYGGFKTKSFYTSVTLVPSYVQQNDFFPAFFQNIETVISFYHSHQAVEYIEGDRSLMTHGETLIKFLFVPIPRSFVQKPISIIEAYTGHFDWRAYKEEHVSWPINFFSELYWNFGYWGWVLIVPIFWMFNKLYFVLLRTLSAKHVLSGLVLLYMYEYFIFFIRGSGLDLYFFTFLLSCWVFITFFLIPYSLFVSVRKPPTPDAG